MSARYYDGEPAINPWMIRLPLLLVSGAVLLLLIAVTLVGLFQLSFRERVMPGVSAYGISLSGLTRDQTRSALQNQFTYGDSTVFTFRYGDRFWQATAGDLGVTFDVDSTVDQAFEIGRGSGLFFNLVDQALVWLNGEPINPLIRYDQGLAAAWLRRLALEIDTPAQDAQLIINGTDVQASAAQNGRWLDVRETLRQIDTFILDLRPGGEIALVVNETPPIAWDAEAAAEKARAAIAAPLVLVAETPDGAPVGPWQARVDQIAALLRVVTVDNGDGTFRYDVDIDMSAFRAYLEGLAQGLIAPPVNGRFHFDETSGRLTVIQPSQSGRSLNVDETLARMEAAVFSRDNRTVPLAFNYTLPPYHDAVTAAELGITQLVSEATTYFSGSTSARRTNIIQAAAAFDGVIVAPGETFSFNSLLGDISPEEGYVSGKVILGGRTVDGVGGGVCQVSTTAFQAAFFGGFPIIERYPHGYRVGYYERGEGVGMDAAIYKPDPDDGPYATELDFRFVNDTDYHLLIETSVFPQSDALQFRFYSTSAGRQVVKVGPEVFNVQPPAATRYEVNSDLIAGQELQVDWSAEGSEVRVTRQILDASGVEVRRDVFYSNYQSWGAVVQVAPGDPRVTG
ncbi:MAG: VanW family protein [Anaerolineae bacterium]|nr:VanW family protein [Anaerolineae bacterium]NUQ05221.1 VanW family protein [Anaerolineae bacterium]